MRKKDSMACYRQDICHMIHNLSDKLFSFADQIEWEEKKKKKEENSNAYVLNLGGV